MVDNKAIKGDHEKWNSVAVGSTNRGSLFTVFTMNWNYSEV